MWLFERNTARRGLEAVPLRSRRSRRWRFCVCCLRDKEDMVGEAEERQDKGYFLPDLPALRRMRSPSYRMPLPL